MTEHAKEMIQNAPNGQMVQLPLEPERQELSRLAIYAQAIQKGLSVADLKGLLDLHERTEKAKAEAAYARDMAGCQADIPALICDDYNQQTKSKYIRLETINGVIRPIYTKWGFAVQFGE